MPSIVKVTNLENGMVLNKVRINDRGPFARNRIIDLSRKAAEELGFIKNGVAKVRVEILEMSQENIFKQIAKVYQVQNLLKLPV